MVHEDAFHHPSEVFIEAIINILFLEKEPLHHVTKKTLLVARYTLQELSRNTKAPIQSVEAVIRMETNIFSPTHCLGLYESQKTWWNWSK
jgi:hypothetical protein